MNTWMNNSQVLAQFGHFFGAYSIVLSTAVFFGGHAWLYVLGALILYAGIKEFWWDMVYELPKQTWADSEEDFAFYALGCLAASGVIWKFLK